MEDKTLWSRVYPIYAGIWTGLLLYVISDAVLDFTEPGLLGLELDWPLLKSAINHYLFLGFFGVSPGLSKLRTLLEEKYGKQETAKAINLWGYFFAGTAVLLVLF